MSSTEGWAEGAALRLADLRDTRNWSRFHTPKNLALALVGEMGEVAELLQWRTNEELAPPQQEELATRLADELADTAIYLMHLAACLGVDLGEAVHEKITATYSRFPASHEEGT